MKLTSYSLNNFHKNTFRNFREYMSLGPVPGNTKGGSFIVPLTSCLTGLELAI
jgi:hypothetical protein